jgi:alkyl hydroperoxide reductase subunit F
MPKKRDRKNKVLDLVIIGAGPAGITAAVYAARKGLDFMVISVNLGGQMVWSGDIDNYTGYHHVKGVELVQKFKEHLDEFDFPFHTGEKVKEIKKKGKLFVVVSDKGKYTARTVIIASGKHPRKLKVPGELQYMSKGLSYCAICDAPLFADKETAVIGGGNAALDAAIQLKNICPKVYVVTINKKLQGDDVMIDIVKKAKNIEVIYNATTTEIFGNDFVKGFKIEVGGKERIINAEGIFVEIGSMPNVDFAKFIKKNRWDEILIKHSGGMLNDNVTSTPGIYAAGDVTDVAEKQIIVAAGEGCKALLSVVGYLNRMKN